jgi:hypothetical protein
MHTMTRERGSFGEPFDLVFAACMIYVYIKSLYDFQKRVILPRANVYRSGISVMLGDANGYDCLLIDSQLCRKE